MRRSLWRFFPLAVVAGLAFVVLVNAGLVYAALYSFPGKTGDEGFELSNHYDAGDRTRATRGRTRLDGGNADGCGGAAGGEAVRP